MKDYMIRATAAAGAVRAFAVTSRELTQQAATRHSTSPVISAALGRLLAAGAMMGAMMKGKDDILTIQIAGDGPAKGLVVTADSVGNVKGYPQAGCGAAFERNGETGRRRRDWQWNSACDERSGT